VARHLVAELRVTVIQQARQLTAAPAGNQLKPDLESGRDGAGLREWHTSHEPTFETRHRGARYAGRGGDIHLPPPSPDPNHPDGATQSLVVHDVMVRNHPYRPQYRALAHGSSR
jgi:hypothetical protein